MDATAFLSRIQSAGFTLELEGGTLFVSPSDQLTDRQRVFIRQHKPELISALTGKAPADPRFATVAAYLADINEPLDSRDDVMARCRADPECLAHFHALATRAPEQPEPLPMPHPEPQCAPTPSMFAGTAVRCADCRHVQPDAYHPALATCGAGRESPAASGFWWTLDKRDCGRFEAITGASQSKEHPNA